MKENNKFRTLSIIAVILIAALSRLIPHPPNITPIIAMSLFGGAYFADKRFAYLIPLAAMLVSDLIIGFHSSIFAVYISIFVISIIGSKLNGKKKAVNIIGASLAASVLFFLITNFSTWLYTGWYPRTFEGLIICYEMAVPFFRYSVFTDLLFAGVFFGGFALAEKRFPALSPVSE